MSQIAGLQAAAQGGYQGGSFQVSSTEADLQNKFNADLDKGDTQAAIKDAGDLSAEAQKDGDPSNNVDNMVDRDRKLATVEQTDNDNKGTPSAATQEYDKQAEQQAGVTASNRGQIEEGLTQFHARFDSSGGNGPQAGEAGMATA